MDAQTINQNYDLLTLAMGDTKLKHAGQFYIGPCPFCGGRDRFNLKRTSDGWRWFCRKCGNDKYHGTIDYIMRRENLDFKQALESLGGHVEIGPREQTRPPEPVITLPDESWQGKTWHRIDAAFDHLQSQNGKPGGVYLTERGISIGTIYLYLLGFDPNTWDPMTNSIRPAIVIPWFDSGPDGEIITAVKHRFIDELAKQDKKYRFGMPKGSQPIIYGLHAAAGHDVLILVEGEINAMSIMQTSASERVHVDALSFGSESGGRKNVLKRVAQDYRRVIVWADDPEKAETIQSSLEGPVTALCSPEVDGLKYDANTLLIKGWLGDFLRSSLRGGV
jgi:hypothetical protein